MYQKNPLVNLTEGIGLTNACRELKDADPKILAAIGPNTLKQYGSNQKDCSIKINYFLSNDYGYMIDSFVVTCKKELKDKVFDIIKKIKTTVIPNIDAEKEYDDRHVRVIFRYTDDSQLCRDEEESISLLDNTINSKHPFKIGDHIRVRKGLRCIETGKEGFVVDVKPSDKYDYDVITAKIIMPDDNHIISMNDGSFEMFN